VRNKQKARMRAVNETRGEGNYKINVKTEKKKERK
jgi:hypothetical protein